MAFDYKDLGKVAISDAPSPATTGTTLKVTIANLKPDTVNAILPEVYPFFATVSPDNVEPTRANSEIIKITAAADTDGGTKRQYTIVRIQGLPLTVARTIVVGDVIRFGPNAQTMKDLENMGVSSQVRGQTPTGSVNGSNKSFTTASTFIANSLRVFLNGIRLTQGVDYAEKAGLNGFDIDSGVTAPQTGDILRVEYDTSAAVFATGSADYAENQVPTGTVNGSNTAFTVPTGSYISGTLKVYRDGQRMKLTDDFTETTPGSGTFAFVEAPLTGSNLIVEYQKSVSVAGNADLVDNIHANATPTSNMLLPLDVGANIPVAVDRHFLHRNAIINGGMQVNQRQASPNVSTNYQYVLDRWAGKAGGTPTAGTITQATTSTNVGSFGFAFRFNAISLSGSGELRIRYRMEAKDAVKFKSLVASFAIKVYHDKGSAVDYTIYIRKPTTTADDFSAVTDISNSGAISVPTGAGTTIKYENISMGDVSKGIEIEILANCGPITGKNFEFTEAVFNKGATALDFQPFYFYDILSKCLRYYRKSFEYDTAPAQAATQLGALTIQNSATNSGVWLHFIPEMRIAPTITTYNPVSANANWRDIDGGADRTVAVDTASKTGVYIRSGSFSAGLVRNLIHWSADAEL